MRSEIRITGFGGQGVILAGYILGKAACVYDGKRATLIQSYGPEARGSACAAQVVISDETIHYPYVRRQDIAGRDVAGGLRQLRRGDWSKDGGAALRRGPGRHRRRRPARPGFVARVPATSTAEQMGRRMAANIVMLGFLAGCTAIVTERGDARGGAHARCRPGPRSSTSRRCRRASSFAQEARRARRWSADLGVGMEQSDQGRGGAGHRRWHRRDPGGARSGRVRSAGLPGGKDLRPSGEGWPSSTRPSPPWTARSEFSARG